LAEVCPQDREGHFKVEEVQSYTFQEALKGSGEYHGDRIIYRIYDEEVDVIAVEVET